MQENIEVVVLGGGCFWCTEAVFKMLKGVKSVLPGYTGGTMPNPTYDEVCGGLTSHVECGKVEFDPTEIKHEDILTVFFGSHDPTTVNRQGNDIGTQYRSVIFYSTPEQKAITEKFITELNASNEMGAKIVTDLEPLGQFYVAENYHQDYFARNKFAPYCELIINPKLEKIQKEFSNLLKENSKN